MTDRPLHYSVRGLDEPQQESQQTPQRSSDELREYVAARLESFAGLLGAECGRIERRLAERIVDLEAESRWLKKEIEVLRLEHRVQRGIDDGSIIDLPRLPRRSVG
jgi:hypothetical protein